MSTTPIRVADATPSTGIDSRHPLYQEFITDWETMRDTYRGQRVVKQRTVRYLPATSGMLADGMEHANSPGRRAYNAYITRALFPDVVNDAVEAMIGVMHHKPPTIELPDVMEPMLENATLRHESLEILLRRINEQQLVTGRLGLMLDMPNQSVADATTLPYIAMYSGERVINWDEGRRDGIVVDNLNLVVLDESEFERKKDFEWDYENKYRILALGDPNETAEGDNTSHSDDLSARNLPEGQGVYRAGVFRDEVRNFNFDLMDTPSIRGNTLDEIPFVFVNAKDVVPEPDDPPLIGLANLALAIYRGDADHRQSLFMQGQDTLVLVGATDDDEVRTGANAVIRLPIGGQAEFIGVDSAGLTEQREALNDDRSVASQKGGQLLDTVSRQRESGEALTVRVAARTATLNQIALAGAFGLEQLLKIAARWIGADPDEVKVTPNLDFIDDSLGGKELVEYMTAKSLGAPMSLQTIHTQMQNKGVTEMDFEEEVSAIEAEAEMLASLNPDGPEDDPDDEDVDEGSEDEDVDDEDDEQ